MDKPQFFNAIKIQDLHILEVTDKPYQVYEKLIAESDYPDYLFGKVYSERYKMPCFICIALPDKMTGETMTIGLATEIAARFMSELNYQEMERAAKDEREVRH